MRNLILASALIVSIGSAASAQAPASTMTMTKTTATKAVRAPEKPRTPASLQCSKDADAKNLHGKPRKTFMSSCKKAATK